MKRSALEGVRTEAPFKLFALEGSFTEGLSEKIHALVSTSVSTVATHRQH